MPIAIQPYRKEHEPAVAQFNQRLRRSSADPDLVFSESSVPAWLPRHPESQVWNELFVATEGAEVRGAYGLKQEQFLIGEKGLYNVACYHHSLSEGIIDRNYASVGVLLARDALERQPLLYVLGMGGFDRPIAKMLKALGFTLVPLPFYFRVVHPKRFLLQMRALREKRWRALLLNLAAYSGLGWLGIRAAQDFRMRKAPGDFSGNEVGEFSDWADQVWQGAKDSVSMSALRDGNTLRLLYPPASAHLTRVRVSRNGKVVGWAVVGERRRDQKFGDMRVGSIVDCWALPENGVAVVRAATEALEKDGVDLIVTNQAHRDWCRAFRSSGFLEGPSTFVLALSKKLVELVQPFEEKQPWFHVTRADGDGLPRNF